MTTAQADDPAPPDPDSDRLGWENGYWYNESVSVDRSNGLNDSELDAVVARSMARVEQIRRLEFQQTPPVAVISREQYQENLSEQFANLSTARRIHQNVKYEALFMVNERTSAVEQQQRNLAGGVLGFYDPTTGNIKIISEDTETPDMNEITLSQELFHALQDQLFNTSGYNQSTRELHNARDGIIEGDGNYVDYLYQQRCEDEWNCLMPQNQGALGSFDPHQGLYRITLQPYMSGPAFVRDRYQDGGWEAVNDVYANPPASSEQVIHPDRYPDDEPTEVHITDTSQAPWHVLDLNNSLDFAQFGEGGLFVALWYPGLESQRQTQIIPFRSHLNFQSDGRSLDPIQPLLYDSSYTRGWDGERLLPYVTNASAETNETGYVYKLEWDTPEDAAEFRDGWEQLMSYHGARQVEGHRNTYRIPNASEYGDAFYLARNGTTVTIVNAPTVADLSQIHAGAAPAVDDGTGDDNGETTATDGTTGETTTNGMDGETSTDSMDGGTTPTAGTTPAGDGSTPSRATAGGDGMTAGTTPTGDGTAGGTTGTAGPGFTAVLALVALLAGTLLASRRL